MNSRMPFFFSPAAARMPKALRRAAAGRTYAGLLLLLLLGGCSQAFLPPISRFEFQTPRPYGYLIGDEIRHRIVIETRQDMRLEPDSVPGQGTVNRWLHLNRVTVESDRDSGNTAIDLEYQVFYAPNEVKMLSIPGFSLRFSQAGKSVEQPVPAWHFTLSPLQELAIRKDENGRAYMRPDVLPSALTADRQWLGFYAALSLSFASGGYLAYLYGYFPAWPRRRIFKRAAAELSALSVADMERALAVMHRALNALNRQPLYKHRLPEFYRTHPEYALAAAQFDWFFDFSNQVLFAGKQDYGSPERGKLAELCRLCREIERGSR